MSSSVLPIFSIILGWSYFLCWSTSFYPQIFNNFKRKSVTGLSFDYVVSNVCGFVFYSIYTTFFLLNESIRESYRQLHDGDNPLVTLNDVAFALHAALVTSITLIQVFVYRVRNFYFNTKFLFLLHFVEKKWEVFCFYQKRSCMLLGSHCYLCHIGSKQCNWLGWCPLLHFLFENCNNSMEILLTGI